MATSRSTRVQLWHHAPATWQPPINAFRCEMGICQRELGEEDSGADEQNATLRTRLEEAQPPQKCLRKPSAN